MLKYLVFWFLFMFSVTGCQTLVQQQTVDLGGGVMATYVTGKVAGDGQEAVFRDAFVDGKPVLTHFHGGQSLPGQILHGTVAAGMVAGGMVGAAALRRPDKYISTETVNADDNSSISQGQGQIQGQAQKASASASAEASSQAHNKTVVTVKPGVMQEGGNSCHGNCGGGNSGNGNPHNND